MGVLSPREIDDLEFRDCTDADWNGDPDTLKITIGLFIEFREERSGHYFPTVRKTSLQTSTGTPKGI